MQSEINLYDNGIDASPPSLGILTYRTSGFLFPTWLQRFAVSHVTSWVYSKHWGRACTQAGAHVGKTKRKLGRALVNLKIINNSTWTEKKNIVFFSPLPSERSMNPSRS